MVGLPSFDSIFLEERVRPFGRIRYEALVPMRSGRQFIDLPGKNTRGKTDYVIKIIV